MDFVGGLPMSKRGHNYFYVVVNRFSKMCILMPCKKKIIAEKNDNIFFQYVWVHFGLPTSIISDRDTRFLGDFWTRLWRMMETKLKKSTAFHPQIDRKI
jgi:hydrogenase maturation factor